MTLSIRQATPDDAAGLANLVTQLGYPSSSEQVAARLTSLQSADDRLLVAETDGVAVGLAHVNRWANLVVDNRAEIVALVVDDKWRGQGIGRALLQAAEEWATQRGCSALQVRTNIVRQRAHEFYFQNGFRQAKTSLTLVKQLVGSQAVANSAGA